MDDDTDSAFENDEEEENRRRSAIMTAMSLEYITALENSLQIEKKRTEHYERLASKTLHILDNLMAEYRAAFEEDLDRELILNTNDSLGPHRTEMIMAAGDEKDDMRVVANAITFYTLEICAHDDRKNVVEQFHRIKKIFQKLGLRCT